VLAAELDISQEAPVVAFVQDAIQALGGFDILVSNAGMIEWEPFTKIMLDGWNRILAVNLTGARLSAREVAKHVVARGQGGDAVHLLPDEIRQVNLP
jgi:NAD(P)-dependent dehydrogenase (short-subunit alcohol dehydrogenase family)